MFKEKEECLKNNNNYECNIKSSFDVNKFYDTWDSLGSRLEEASVYVSGEALNILNDIRAIRSSYTEKLKPLLEQQTVEGTNKLSSFIDDTRIKLLADGRQLSEVVSAQVRPREKE
jgi:hypothetical protein